MQRSFCFQTCCRSCEWKKLLWCIKCNSYCKYILALYLFIHLFVHVLVLNSERMTQLSGNFLVIAEIEAHQRVCHQQMSVSRNEIHGFSLSANSKQNGKAILERMGSSGDASGEDIVLIRWKTSKNKCRKRGRMKEECLSIWPDEAVRPASWEQTTHECENDGRRCCRLNIHELPRTVFVCVCSAASSMFIYKSSHVYSCWIM